MKRESHHKRTMVVVLGLFSFFMLIQNAHAAYQFKVGGSGDWSLASSSSYEQWAHKNRFQTGDTLFFNYQADEDSVLQVSASDYKNCNTSSPIAKYSDGHTAIMLNQSGPYYFISGSVDHCKKNQKVVIVVLADRSNHSLNAPSPTPSIAPPPALPPAPVSEEIPSPPPAPGAPEPDMTPASTPSEENHPPTPNGASSMMVNSFCFVGAFIGISLLFNF